MVSRSEEFRVTGDEEHIMYEGEEGDMENRIIDGSSDQILKMERRDFQNPCNSDALYQQQQPQREVMDSPGGNEIFHTNYDRDVDKRTLHGHRDTASTRYQDINGESLPEEQLPTPCSASDNVVEAPLSGERPSENPPVESEHTERTRESSCEPTNATKRDSEEHGAGCTLYVRNLPPHIRTEHVKDHFAQFGQVIDCRIIMNPVTKDSRGFGFVSFATPEIADLAMEKSVDVRIDGKVLRVEKARRNRPHDPTPGEYKGPTGASIKYDNCGRLKPGHYRRSSSRDQGRMSSYRGGTPRRMSGNYGSRHYKCYDSRNGRDYGYGRGTSPARMRVSPYPSGRSSYQSVYGGVAASSRDSGYHRSGHMNPPGSSRNLTGGLSKSITKAYDGDHLSAPESDTMAHRRSSSRYYRDPMVYNRNHWEKSSRASYGDHPSKDQHHRGPPYPVSHHGTNAEPSRRSSAVYGSSRHGSSRAGGCDEHEYYGSSAMIGTTDRFCSGNYSQRGSSQLRSRRLSNEPYGHHGPSNAYGGPSGGAVSRRRVSPSPPPESTGRYPHSRNAPAPCSFMRGAKNDEPNTSLYASNERIASHMSSGRSRSPIDGRGAPNSSSFVCHH